MARIRFIGVITSDDLIILSHRISHSWLILSIHSYVFVYVFRCWKSWWWRNANATVCRGVVRFGPVGILPLASALWGKLWRRNSVTLSEWISPTWGTECHWYFQNTQGGMTIRWGRSGLIGGITIRTIVWNEEGRENIWTEWRRNWFTIRRVRTIVNGTMMWTSRGRQEDIVTGRVPSLWTTVSRCVVDEVII